MTKKEFIAENYEKVTTKESGGIVLNFYKPRSMRPLPRQLIEEVEPENFLRRPIRGNTWGIENPDYGIFDVLVVRHLHGNTCDYYVCSILVRPFSEEARQHYSENWPTQPFKRLKLMWDSRIFDEDGDHVRKYRVESDKKVPLFTEKR